MRKTKAPRLPIFLTLPSLFFSFLLVSTLFFVAPAQGSEQESAVEKHLAEANTAIKAYRHFDGVDSMLKALEQADDKYPSVHMRLGILYYGLGFLQEAIDQGEKAVALAPSSKWYTFDLAKFYFADKQLDKAQLLLHKLLKLDPGFSTGYYYLAQLYFQKQDFDKAWLSLQRARSLGFKGEQLQQKLLPLRSQPEERGRLKGSPDSLVRFIKVDGAQKAGKILGQLQAGNLFENIELQHVAGKSDTSVFGLMQLNELPDEVTTSLKESAPYAAPVIVKTGPDYRIVQKILPFNPDSWDQPREVQVNQVADSLNFPPAQKGSASPGMSPSPSPESDPTASSKPSLSSKLAAMYAVESWQTAWTEQNLNGYFKAYSPNFVPAGKQSLENWKKKRQRSVSKPSFINIDIKDLVIETLSNRQVQATFVQSYESDSYGDVVRKSLLMQKESNGWKIVKESEIEKMSP